MPLHNRNLKTRFPDFCWRVLMGSSCLIRTLSQARLTLPHFTACLYPIPRMSRSALPALSSGNRMVFPFFPHPCPDSAPPSVECSSLLSRNLLPVFGWRARIVFFDSPHIHAQPHISSVASEPGTHHVTIQEPLPVFGRGTHVDFIDCLTPDHQYSASITPGTLFFPAVRIREAPPDSERHACCGSSTNFASPTTHVHWSHGYPHDSPFLHIYPIQEHIVSSSIEHLARRLPRGFFGQARASIWRRYGFHPAQHIIKENSAAHVCGLPNVHC